MQINERGQLWYIIGLKGPQSVWPYCHMSSQTIKLCKYKYVCQFRLHLPSVHQPNRPHPPTPQTPNTQTKANKHANTRRSSWEGIFKYWAGKSSAKSRALHNWL